MQMVRAGIPESRPILDQICPGRAPSDRMGAVANYLAQQIKVKIKIQFENFSQSGSSSFMYPYFLSSPLL